ncbi:MAG: hypothetical protein AAB442_02575 [Patescibacteria group bacterium]
MNLVKTFLPRLGVFHAALLVCGAYVIAAAVTEVVFFSPDWTPMRVFMTVSKLTGGVMFILLPLVDVLENDPSFDTTHEWRLRRHVAQSLAVVAGLVTLTCLAAAGAMQEGWLMSPFVVLAAVLALWALWLCVKLVLETG